MAGGIDALAITHLDRVPQIPFGLGNAYEAAGDFPDAQRYFVTDGNRITDLRVGTPGHLDFLDELTRALSRVTPVLDSPPQANLAAFVANIELSLSARVGITANGPTAADFRFLRKT